MRVDAEYLTNTGTVLVDALAELELANASTIDGGVITNHGELEATAGSNTIKNVTGSNFTNTGTIEVVAGIGTDRKSVEEGKRVDPGGGRIINKKKHELANASTND